MSTLNGRANGEKSATGLGQLIMTAVVDRELRDQLLTEPVEAMAGFELTDAEQEAVISTKAGSLPELAAQLHQWAQQRDLLHAVLQEDERVYLD